MPGPLVSIVIPTRDRPALLRRAISSVLCQSYNNIELIVIDDGQSGDALKVYEETCDDRVRVYRNQHEKGACGSRNTGIEVARGAYYTGLDDDDYFHEHRIRVLLSAYRKEHSFVSSNSVHQWDGGERVEFRGGCVIRLSDLLWGRNCVGNQILTETTKMRAVGGFDESLVAGQDIDLWVRMIDRWGAALRIAACLYTADFDHGGPRISTTVKVARRTQDFLDRHGDRMSQAQTLVNLTRLRRHTGKQYAWALARSLCFPTSWNFYFRRMTREW